MMPRPKKPASQNTENYSTKKVEYDSINGFLALTHKRVFWSTFFINPSSKKTEKSHHCQAK